MTGKDLINKIKELHAEDLEVWVCAGTSGDPLESADVFNYLDYRDNSEKPSLVLNNSYHLYLHPSAKH